MVKIRAQGFGSEPRSSFAIFVNPAVFVVDFPVAIGTYEVALLRFFDQISPRLLGEPDAGDVEQFGPLVAMVEFECQWSFLVTAAGTPAA